MKLRGKTMRKPSPKAWKESILARALCDYKIIVGNEAATQFKFFSGKVTRRKTSVTTLRMCLVLRDS